MSSDEPPVGKLFSRVYLKREAPLRDSERFRNRIAAYFSNHIHRYYAKKVVSEIHEKLGVHVPLVGGVPSCGAFFSTTENIKDILDSITLIYRVLLEQGARHAADLWRDMVSEVLHEENLGYRVDEKCGVHLFIDEEFERNLVSTLECIAEYPAVAGYFESAHQHLEAGRSLEAVRAMFDAVELLMKKMVGGKKITSLGANDVGRHLKPIARDVYSDTAMAAANQLFNGFAGWIFCMIWMRL